MLSDLPLFLKENEVEIAILTLPKNKAKEMAKILIDNGIKEYSRKIQEYPYKDGTFTVIDFLDKDNNGVAIIAENLTQDIETEVYERFNKLYNNAYEMDLIDD